MCCVHMPHQIADCRAVMLTNTAFILNTPSSQELLKGQILAHFLPCRYCVDLSCAICQHNQGWPSTLLGRKKKSDVARGGGLGVTPLHACKALLQMERKRALINPFSWSCHPLMPLAVRGWKRAICSSIRWRCRDRVALQGWNLLLPE